MGHATDDARSPSITVIASSSCATHRSFLKNQDLANQPPKQPRVVKEVRRPVFPGIYVIEFKSRTNSVEVGHSKFAATDPEVKLGEDDVGDRIALRLACLHGGTGFSPLP